MQKLINGTGNSHRIIAEELHSHWSAWFAVPSSNETYGGADAMDAIQRLITNSSQWNVQLTDFEPDWDNCSSRRIEMVYMSNSRMPCPDCGGTGKYVGLNIIEPCVTCRGGGE